GARPAGGPQAAGPRPEDARRRGRPVLRDGRARPLGAPDRQGGRGDVPPGPDAVRGARHLARRARNRSRRDPLGQGESRAAADGLHQAVEAKEGVAVREENQTLATITIQNYFRMYQKLAGMTGTAETEEREFWEIYKLDVMVIPTNRPVRRIDKHDLIYKTRREKYNAIMDEIERQHQRGLPVLVGTVSVDVSETLSRMIKRRGLKHEVL